MNEHPWVVTSASGGIGGTALAAGLAGALAEPFGGCLLVDLDPMGGGLDVSCGLEHLEGLRWPDLADVRGGVDGRRLRRELPARGRCAVLSAGPSRVDPSLPMPPRAVVDALVESLPGAGVPVVLDLPRFAPWPAGLVPDPWILMTGTRTRELADLDALVTRIDGFLPASERDRVVFVTTGTPPPPELTEAIEDHLGFAHLGHIARDRALARSMESGAWPRGTSHRTVIRRLLDRSRTRGAA